MNAVFNEAAMYYNLLPRSAQTTLSYDEAADNFHDQPYQLRR